MKLLFLLTMLAGIASCTDPQYEKTRREKLKQNIDSTHDANTGETGFNQVGRKKYLQLIRK